MMLKLTNIEKVFETSEIKTIALCDINLNVEKSDFISVMGPSGCGKSTLLNIMGLLDTPTRGSVMIEGVDVAKLNDRDLAHIRNEKLGFVFQSFHLLPGLSVIDNVCLPLLYASGRITTAAMKLRATKVLEKVGLASRMKHFPKQLSGGQCQRAAIARAIINNPSLILADEPTGNLDSNMGNEIMEVLTQLNKDGATIVMVTHDSQIAQRAQISIVMNDGKIRAIVDNKINQISV